MSKRSLEAALRLFLQELAARNVSVNTITAYSTDLRQFIAWLQTTNGTIARPDQVTKREIIAYLDVTSFGKAARHQAALAIREAARRMDRPSDPINVAIETLVKERFELPAFSTLDTLARRVRTLVNTAFFRKADDRLTMVARHW